MKKILTLLLVFVSILILSDKVFAENVTITTYSFEEVSFTDNSLGVKKNVMVNEVAFDFSSAKKTDSFISLGSDTTTTDGVLSNLDNFNDDLYDFLISYSWYNDNDLAYVVQTSSSYEGVNNLLEIKINWDSFVGSFYNLYLLVRYKGEDELSIGTALSSGYCNYFNFAKAEFDFKNIDYFACVFIPEGNSNNTFVKLKDITITCSNTPAVLYNVYFYSDIALFKKEQVVVLDKVRKPSDPNISGLEFEYWHELNSDTPFDFSTIITKDVYLYAKFKRAEAKTNTVFSYTELQYDDELTDAMYKNDVYLDNPDGIQFYFLSVYTLTGRGTTYKNIRLNNPLEFKNVTKLTKFKKIIITFSNSTVTTETNMKKLKLNVSENFINKDNPGTQISRTGDPEDNKIVFDIPTSGNYHYFSLNKTTDGAVYIDNIEIVYDLKDKDYEELAPKLYGQTSALVDDKVNLRFVGTSLTRNIVELGFKVILIKESNPYSHVTLQCSSLYNKISSSSTTVELAITAESLNTNYLFAYTIIGVPKNTKFYVYSYFVDDDLEIHYSEPKIYYIDDLGNLSVVEEL